MLEKLGSSKVDVVRSNTELKREIVLRRRAEVAVRYREEWVPRLLWNFQREHHNNLGAGGGLVLDMPGWGTYSPVNSL